MAEDYRSDLERSAAHWRTLLDLDTIRPTPITPKIVSEIMRQRLAMTCKETGLTWAQMMADAAIKRAILTGDVREVLDRVEGRVAQPLAHTGADGGAVEVVHTVRPSVSREEWLRERGITVLETASRPTVRRTGS